MRIDSIITVHKDELTERQWRKLFVRLSFRDADENEISAFQYVSERDEVLLPRGALDMLPSKLDVIDLRSRPPMPKIMYAKELDAIGYGGQSKAIVEMFAQQNGQVIAPPGRGKTEIGLAFAATSRTRTLVVVHTQDLMKQWVERAADSVPGMKVGTIQGSTCQVEHLTVAMAQTLKRYIGAGGKFWRQFGAIIVDEAHHAAAETWEWLLNVCPAYYRFGVTASEKRSDGRQALVRFNIGPVIYKLKFESQVPMTIVPVRTGFKTKWNGQQWRRILFELVRDPERNRRIAELTANAIAEGNFTLVLSRQIKHLELIYEALPEHVNAKIVTGRLKKDVRDQLIDDLREGTLHCILGTQLFEEGVDIPRLNRIILAFPGTEITALQKIGRGSRKFEGKDECIIFDMVDDLVRVLAKQYLRRKRWYKSVGLTVAKVKEVDNAEKKKGRKLGRRFSIAR